MQERALELDIQTLDNPQVLSAELGHVSLTSWSLSLFLCPVE